MWLNFNSNIHFNDLEFFKLASTANLYNYFQNIREFILVYNTDLEKFFLMDRDKRVLIYLDDSKYHNSYIKTYLKFEDNSYISELEYYSNSSNFINTIPDPIDVTSLDYEFFEKSSPPMFQTKDGKYVLVFMDIPKVACRSLRISYGYYRYYIIEREEYEQGVISSSNYRHFSKGNYQGKYIYGEVSGQNRFVFAYENITNVRRPNERISEIGIFNNYKRIESIFDLPIWVSNDRVNFTFDISKNSIPDELPVNLFFGYDLWKIPYISSDNHISIVSFINNINKNNIKQFGFTHGSPYCSSFYKKYNQTYMDFVVIFSEELNGYKFFDINNENAGYFLCKDIDCMKPTKTSFKFEAFLNKDIYRNEIFEEFTNNGLVLELRNDLSSNDVSISNYSYNYCINHIKELKNYYSFQLPFVRA